MFGFCLLHVSSINIAALKALLVRKCREGACLWLVDKKAGTGSREVCFAR